MTEPERMVYALAYVHALHMGQPDPADCAAGAVEYLRADKAPCTLLNPERRKHAQKMLGEFRAGIFK